MCRSAVHGRSHMRVHIMLHTYRLRHVVCHELVDLLGRHWGGLTQPHPKLGVFDVPFHRITKYRSACAAGCRNGSAGLLKHCERRHRTMLTRPVWEPASRATHGLRAKGAIEVLSCAVKREIFSLKIDPCRIFPFSLKITKSGLEPETSCTEPSIWPPELIGIEHT